MNVVVLSGRLAAPPEIRELEDGARLGRYLLTVRCEGRRPRVDVVPVTLWDPPHALAEGAPPPGTRVWMTGSVQRRFLSGAGGRRSRLEVVAAHLEFRPELADEAGPGCGVEAAGEPASDAN